MLLGKVTSKSTQTSSSKLCKCKQYYEENEIDKKELNKILKERKLNDLDEEPHQMECLYIRKIGKCQFCYL